MYIAGYLNVRKMSEMLVFRTFVGALPIFEQNVTINFEPIFEQNANFDPIFEKSAYFGPIFEKSVNFEHFVNGK